MVDCISRKAILDKFIGDAIMACFGLPVAREDDPDRAVRAAIEMIRRWRWNAERRAAGLKTVEMGVGINTDLVVSGNIGTPKRMDYTVIGDGVNLASRLESASKQYSARILVSNRRSRGCTASIGCGKSTWSWSRARPSPSASWRCSVIAQASEMP
jgi:adenylate cyclase